MIRSCYGVSYKSLMSTLGWPSYAVAAALSGLIGLFRLNVQVLWLNTPRVSAEMTGLPVVVEQMLDCGFVVVSHHCQPVGVLGGGLGLSLAVARPSGALQNGSDLDISGDAL